MKFYGSIYFKSNKWIIDELAPHARGKLKDIFRKVGRTQLPPYSFNDTLTNCNDLDWFMLRYPLKISKGDRQKLSRRKNECVKLNNHIHELMLPTSYPKIDAQLKPPFKFMPHQARNIALHKIVKGLLIGDKLGNGKTLSGIGTCFDPDNLPCAIVVEPQIQIQWGKKISEFTNLSFHSINSTRPYDLPKAHIYIFRYSQLAGWIDVFSEGFFSSVIYDEIQSLRTGIGTKKGQAAKVLSDNAKARLGLSALQSMAGGLRYTIFTVFLARIL